MAKPAGNTRTLTQLIHLRPAQPADIVMGPFARAATGHVAKIDTDPSSCYGRPR